MIDKVTDEESLQSPKHRQSLPRSGTRERQGGRLFTDADEAHSFGIDEESGQDSFGHVLSTKSNRRLSWRSNASDGERRYRAQSNASEGEKRYRAIGQGDKETNDQWIKEMDDELDFLHTENGEMQQKVNDLQREKRQMMEELREVQDAHDKHFQDQLEMEIAKRTANLGASPRSKSPRRDVEDEDHQKELEGLRLELDEERAAAWQLKKEVTKVSEQASDLQRDLDESSLHLQAALEESRIETTENQKLQRKVSEMESALQDLNIKQQVRSQNSRRLLGVPNEDQGLDPELAELDKGLKERGSLHVDLMQAKQLELQGIVARQEEELKQLRSDRPKSKDLQSHSALRAELEGKIKTEEEEVQRLRSDLTRAEQLAQSRAHGKADSAQVNEQLDELEGVLKHEMEEVRKLQRSKADRGKELKELRSELAESEEVLRENTAHQEDLEGELKMEKQAMKKIVKKHKASLEELELVRFQLLDTEEICSQEAFHTKELEGSLKAEMKAVKKSRAEAEAGSQALNETSGEAERLFEEVEVLLSREKALHASFEGEMKAEREASEDLRLEVAYYAVLHQELKGSTEAENEAAAVGDRDAKRREKRLVASSERWREKADELTHELAVKQTAEDKKWMARQNEVSQEMQEMLLLQEKSNRLWAEATAERRSTQLILEEVREEQLFLQEAKMQNPKDALLARRRTQSEMLKSLALVRKIDAKFYPNTLQ